MSDETNPNTEQVTSPPATVPATETVSQAVQEPAAVETPQGQIPEPGAFIPRERFNEVIAERNALRAQMAQATQPRPTGVDPMTANVARELGLPEDQATKLSRVIIGVAEDLLAQRDMATTLQSIKADPHYAELEAKVEARFRGMTPKTQAQIQGNPEMLRVLYDSVKSELIPAATRQGIQQGQLIAQANAQAKTAIPRIPTGGGASTSGALTRDAIAKMTPAERETREAEIKAAVLSGTLR